MRRIVVLVAERASMLSVTALLECLSLTNEQVTPAPYAVQVVSASGGPVMTLAGCALLTIPYAACDSEIDTLVLSGGHGCRAAAGDAALVGWVARAGAAARRLCCVGSGAWLAAAAGLLQGARVVTHWLIEADLRARYPQLQLSAGSVFAHDGRIWSSAGESAAIDMALALVQDDLGYRVAVSVARLLVVFMKRPAGQPQVSMALSAQTSHTDRFEELNSWLADHLHRPLSVEDMAARAGMSLRNFSRAYHLATGRTPAKALEAMRVEAACRALDGTEDRISDIAHRAGFGDEERLRRALVRAHGMGPREYRNRGRPAARPK